MRRDADRPLFKDVVEGTVAAQGRARADRYRRAGRGLDLGARRPPGARHPARRRLRADPSQATCRRAWRSTNMSRSPMPSTTRASRASSTRCSIAWRARSRPAELATIARWRRRRIGEFELIARYFAPLARSFRRRRRPRERQRLPRRPIRATTSSSRPTRSSRACISWPTRSPSWWRRKALRVCLSDLAAGGGDALRLPALAVAAEGVERALGRRLCARSGRGPAPLRHRAVRRRHCGDAGPAHRHRHRLRRGAARPRPDTRRRAGRRRLLVSGTIGDGALGLLAARGRIAVARRSRSAIACRSRARRWGRDWSASRARPPMSPTACWPTPATSPRRRGLPCASSASGCRCPPPLGA